MTTSDTTANTNGPTPTEQERQQQLAHDAAAVTGTVSEAIWKRAKLAHDAKNDKVRDWASVIAIACRRASRTVRAWAVTYEWTVDTGLLPLIAKLDYSFFELAERFSDRVDELSLKELLNTYIAESGASLESFGAELADLAGKPEPDPAKGWKRMSEKLFGQVDAEVPEVGLHLQAAAKALAAAVSEKAKLAGEMVPA